MTKNININEQNNSTKAILGPSVSIILAALGISAAAVVLPEVSLEFQDSVFDPSLVVSAYILAVTALIVPAGRAGDVFGKRTVLIYGLILFTIGVLIASFATTLPVLIASRFLQGAGAAAMMAMPLAQVREIAPAGQTGRWMGVMGTMSAIGTASGPALAGGLAGSFDWRAVFLVQIPLAACALTLSAVFLKNSTRDNAQNRIDFAGAVALIIFLAAFVLMISDIKNGIDLSVVLLLVISIFSFSGFWVIESRTKVPLIPLKLLRSVRLRISFILNAAVSLIMMGILIIGPFYLTLGLGLTTAQMGLVMSVGPITSALSGMPAGRLTEKLGPQRTVVFGLSGMIIATAAMAGLPYLFGLSGFILAFMVLTPSYQVFLAALNTSVMERTLEHDQGVTSGLLNLSRNLGFILGASTMGAVFWSIASFDTGLKDDMHNISRAMAGTFACTCVLVSSAMVLLLRSKSAHSKD